MCCQRCMPHGLARPGTTCVNRVNRCASRCVTAASAAVPAAVSTACAHTPTREVALVALVALMALVALVAMSWRGGDDLARPGRDALVALSVLLARFSWRCASGACRSWRGAVRCSWRCTWRDALLLAVASVRRCQQDAGFARSSAHPAAPRPVGRQGGAWLVAWRVQAFCVGLRGGAGLKSPKMKTRAGARVAPRGATC